MTTTKIRRAKLAFITDGMGRQMYSILDIKQERSDIADRIERLAKNPFPEDIFIPPTKAQYAKLHEALSVQGLTLDKFSGDIARRAHSYYCEELNKLAKEVRGDGK